MLQQVAILSLQVLLLSLLLFPSQSLSSSLKFQGSRSIIPRLVFLSILGNLRVRTGHILASGFDISTKTFSTTSKLHRLNMSSSSSRDPTGGNLKRIRFTSPLTSEDTIPTFLILLNTPIPCPVSPLFQKLWNTSHYRICADGGANRLYDATVKTDDSSVNYIPNVIRGDLDSLQTHVADYYASEPHNVAIEKDPCQDTNDLDKALQKVQQQLHADQTHRVIVYGGFGGRFDQEMASFQALYKWGATFQHQIWLYSEETLAFLVPSTLSRNSTEAGLAHDTIVEVDLPYDYTKTPDSSIQEGPTCGLIPMACPCRSITTTGLQWNLEDTRMEFGGLVSTSNRIVSNPSKVTIQTSDPIIFTAEIIVKR